LKTISNGQTTTAVERHHQRSPFASQGVSVNLPLRFEATVANFGVTEIKDALVQLSIDGQNKEQKLTSIPPGRAQ